MRYEKRTNFSVKTRTRYVDFQFSSKKDASKTMLGASSITNCIIRDGVLKNIPERAAVYNKSNHQYRCGIANLLRIGSWKKYNSAKAVYEDVYYAMSTQGAFFLYMEDKESFYTVVSNAGKIEFQPLETADGYHFALFTQGRLFFGKTDGTYKVVISSNVLPAGTYFKHRLFVAKRHGTLAYSAPEDFSNFTESVDEGGSVRFSDGGGEIVAVKVYDDALYVFFTNSIMRLEIGGDPCDFRVERIEYQGGDIFSRTVCVCDHGIYFLARNGLHRLRGKKIERLQSEIVFMKEEGNEDMSAVLNGSILMHCRDAGGIYQTFIIHENGEVCPMAPMRGFSNGQDGRVLLVDVLKNIYQLVDDGQGDVWYSGSYVSTPSNFGYTGIKTVRTIRLYGKGTGYLYLKNVRRMQMKRMVFKDGLYEWKPRMKGDVFTLGFDIDRESEIRKVEVIFDMPTAYKEEKV